MKSCNIIDFSPSINKHPISGVFLWLSIENQLLGGQGFGLLYCPKICLQVTSIVLNKFTIILGYAPHFHSAGCDRGIFF